MRRWRASGNDGEVYEPGALVEVLTRRYNVGPGATVDPFNPLPS